MNSVSGRSSQHVIVGNLKVVATLIGNIQCVCHSCCACGHHIHASAIFDGIHSLTITPQDIAPALPKKRRNNDGTENCSNEEPNLHVN